MENKHIVAIAGFVLLVLLMVLLVFQSNKTPKMGEDLTGLNIGQGTSPTPAPVTELSGRDISVGSSSAVVSAGDTIVIHYIGAFMDKKIFDSSLQRNEPFTFQVGGGQIIKGIEQGVLGMKIGGKRLLQIPAELAYGAAGQGEVIPPNTPLLFQIDLLDIKPKEALLPSPSPEVPQDSNPNPNPEENANPEESPMPSI